MLMRSFFSKTLIFLLLIFITSCSSNINYLDDRTFRENNSLSKFEKDRNAILNLAGNFKVKFRFEETISFKKDYKLKKPYITSAYEVVKIIRDDGDQISFQHILVANVKDKHFAIKHWRQVWKFQPSRVLVFIGGNAWKQREVERKDSFGSWSQTVYQVDDSPRYGAIGRWSHKSGISEWLPSPEWRPLPRRDMTKRNDYHTIDAVNRHVITPWGWVHEEDNSKLILKGKNQILAREIGVNSYERNNDFKINIAEEYIKQTEDFWKKIRIEWKNLEDSPEGFKLTLKGEPEELYMALLGKAEEYLVKEITLNQALSEAKEIIKKYTTTKIGPLDSRLRKKNL